MSNYKPELSVKIETARDLLNFLQSLKPEVLEQPIEVIQTEEGTRVPQPYEAHISSEPFWENDSNIGYTSELVSEGHTQEEIEANFTKVQEAGRIIVFTK